MRRLIENMVLVCVGKSVVRINKRLAYQDAWGKIDISECGGQIVGILLLVVVARCLPAQLT